MRLDILSLILSGLSFIPIAFASVKWLYGQTYTTVTFSCGSFKTQRKYMNVADLTRITADLFFGGGKIDDNIRQEIFATSIKVKDKAPNPNYTPSKAAQQVINGGAY